MAIELVTGATGTPHVSSADVGAFNAGIVGPGSYLLAHDPDEIPFEIDILTNKVVVNSGEAVINGRHVRIPKNSVEELPLERLAGSATRGDIIAIKYSKDADSHESASVEILKGTAGIGNYNFPVINSGNILNGDSEAWFPLYKLYINGLEVREERLNEGLISLSDISKFFGWNMGTSFLDYVYPVGSVYISTNNIDPGKMFGGRWVKIEDSFLLACGNRFENGSTGGSTSVCLTTSNLPGHTHSIDAHSHAISIASAGTHKHTIPRSMTGATGTVKYTVSTSDGKTTTTSETGAHTHTATCGSASMFTKSTGGSLPFSIMPPYFAVCMWYRVS